LFGFDNLEATPFIFDGKGLGFAFSFRTIVSFMTYNFGI